MSDDNRQEKDVNTYLCEKTGQRVSMSEPVCPKPERACKYRLDCIIYALYEDDLYAQSQAGTGPRRRVTFLPGQSSALIDSVETLLDADRRAGYVLACQSGAPEDLVVEIPPEARKGKVQALGEQSSIIDIEA